MPSDNTSDNVTTPPLALNAHDSHLPDQATQPSDQPSADPRALLVLLGTALTRMRTLALRSPPDQLALSLQAIQLYAPLAHSVGFGGEFAQLETLAYQRLFPDSLARLQRWFRLIWPDASRLVNTLCAQVEAQIEQDPVLAATLDSFNVDGRVKTVSSTFRKLLRDQKQIRQLNDVVALRVVLRPSADAASVLEALSSLEFEEGNADALLCHGVYRQIAKLLPEVPGRFKDFISNPKPNGYQSIHSNMQLSDGRVVELQVRTDAMHERATRGSAAHEGYRARQLGGGLEAELDVAHQASRVLKGVQLKQAALLPAAPDAVEVVSDSLGHITPSRKEAKEGGRALTASQTQSQTESQTGRIGEFLGDLQT